MEGKPGVGGTRWVDLGLMALAGACALLLAEPVAGLRLHRAISYNEGWNAFWAMRAAGLDTRPLYPPPGSLIFNNYPPLSFLLVGAIGRWLTGDMILAGRAAALAGLGFSAILLAASLRGFGAAWRAGAAAGLLLVAFACLTARGYVGMDDPQWLAHAVMLGGLAALVRRGPNPSAGAAAAAALLVLCGGLIKHNLVALPLAVTLYLVLWGGRRAALGWIVAASAGLLIAVAAILSAYGTDALRDVLLHARVYELHGMLRAARRVPGLLPMAAGALLLTRDHCRRPAVRFAALFVAIALPTGIVQGAGDGVAVNASFETLIALCFAGGVLVDLALRGELRRTRPGALLLVACLPLLAGLPHRLGAIGSAMAANRAEAGRERAEIAQIAAAPGDAACETLALCYWAGKAFTIDFFNLTQYLLKTGDDRALRALTGSARIGVIQYLPDGTIHREAIRAAGTDPLMTALLPGFAEAGRFSRGSVVLRRE